MTDYTEMVKRLRACAGGECRHYLRIGDEPCIAPLLREAADAIERLAAAVEFLPQTLDVEAAVFDEEEVHENVTVVIWRNSVTGEESIGWYEDGGEA